MNNFIFLNVYQTDKTMIKSDINIQFNLKILYFEFNPINPNYLWVECQMHMKKNI